MILKTELDDEEDCNNCMDCRCPKTKRWPAAAAAAPLAKHAGVEEEILLISRACQSRLRRAQAAIRLPSHFHIIEYHLHIISISFDILCYLHKEVDSSDDEADVSFILTRLISHDIT